MKNELNEYLLSRIIIDLTKIKKILEDGSEQDVVKTANEEIDNLIEKIQDIPVNDG